MDAELGELRPPCQCWTLGQSLEGLGFGIWGLEFRALGLELEA